MKRRPLQRLLVSCTDIGESYRRGRLRILKGAWLWAIAGAVAGLMMTACMFVLRNVLARATDGTGALQAPDERDPLPSGATGYHRATIEVVQ